MLRLLLPALIFLPPVLLSPTTQAQPAGSEALQRIEGVRGGRHWIDEPTAPPKTPEESYGCLQIEPGYKIQLIAQEPLVKDPVAITFDDRGRMYVVEYGDYPVGPPEGEEPLSRIVLLDDTDHDGTVDRRVVFADRLHFAHSFMAWNGGLLVGAHSEILFLKDTNNDHVADVREVLFDGFTPAHPQMQIGCPRWGLNNWIYLTYGPGKVAAAADADKRVSLPRKDFRFHPETMAFEADTGLGQYGNTIDRWGHRFFCTNRSPILTTLLPSEVLKRNPFAIIPNVEYSVGKAGGATRVYPLVAMKSNYLSHAGTHTAACGVTAYTGDLTAPDLQNSVFVCEPIGHLVTRSVVEPQGVRLQARRARPKADFLASTDPWFRPVSLSNGPDGALYLADMYRLWVEHPKFLPPDIAARIDWRAGDDRGRIYRIVPADADPRAFEPADSLEQQVALLRDSNGWRQYLGQRLLVESAQTDAVPAVRQLLASQEHPTTRLHALWTLDGLHAVTPNDLLPLLSDAHPVLRRDAIRLTASHLDQTDVLTAVCRCAGDTDPRVRFELAVALGNTGSETATETLIRLTLQDGQDPWFLRGLLTSVNQRSAALIRGLVSSQTFSASGSASRVDLIKQLAAVTGARGDTAELQALLQLLTSEEPLGNWWRTAAISGLGSGLPRHRGSLGRTSLTKLLAAPPEDLAESAARLGQMLQKHQQRPLDSSQPVADRVAAVELLAYRPFAESSDVLNELLAGGQPVALQSAAIRALSSSGDAAAPIIIERWPEIGPSVRSQALGALLRRPESVRLALTAMADGRMNASALSVDQRVILLKHKDYAIRSAAEELFGGAVSTNRKQVIDEYQQALTLKGSVEAGAKVFKRVCARCHQIDGEGHNVGPDITDVRNRSHSAILFDVLDPNAKVEPRFTAYTVVTIDGRTFSGLMTTDSAESVTLTMPEGRQQTIGRSEIDEIRASEVSLMPEGVEKDITVQDMAHLLEFLKNRPLQSAAR